MNILFIGGNFDDNGGRPSSLVWKFVETLAKKETLKVIVKNGGYFSEIEELLNNVNEDNLILNSDIVFWWANVPNDKPKMRDVKSINSKVMLVTSKRNDNEKYSFQELINRALGTKSNLCVEFSKDNESGKYNMMVFDPLGNCWFNGDNIVDCCDALVERLLFLKDITRQGTINIKEKEYDIVIPNEVEFFDVIKEYADIFHTLIKPAANVTRFLGNSSFRCQRGFPSFRKGGLIYVSKRNIDKRFIDKNGFVPTKLVDEKVYYYGENKPSVDTPIQLRLYEKLTNINYMVHAHVYVKNAPFTNHMIPCGGLEEVNEILETIKKEYNSFEKDFYILNLVGHGCIVMSNDVEKLKNIEFDFVGRELPEYLNN